MKILLSPFVHMIFNSVIALDVVSHSLKVIQTKLLAVHCSQQAFDENTPEAIANTANGISRLLNKLARSCLLIANVSSLDHVDSEIVMQAVNDCQLDQAFFRQQDRATTRSDSSGFRGFSEGRGSARIPSFSPHVI